MSFWCVFLDPDLTMHHLNIGIHKISNQIRPAYLSGQEQSRTLMNAKSGREPYS